MQSWNKYFIVFENHSESLILKKNIDMLIYKRVWIIILDKYENPNETFMVNF